MRGRARISGQLCALGMLLMVATTGCEEPLPTDVDAAPIELLTAAADHDGGPIVTVHEDVRLDGMPGAAGDNFGLGVALDGDQAIVGVPGEDDGGFFETGAAHAYTFDGTNWNAAPIVHPPVQAERFGHDVVVDGTRAIITAPAYRDGLDPVGAAYVYELNGTWTQTATLLASDRVAGNLFGVSADLDGDLAIVGDFQDADPLASGKAYVYRYDGANWVKEAILIADDPAGGDKFGFAVGIEGDYAVVGAYNKPTAGTADGAAYVFHYDGVVWDQVAKLTSSATGGTHFGQSVAIDGGRILVGAPGEWEGPFTPGAAYVYDIPGWATPTRLLASDAASEVRFGAHVDIAGDLLVVGAETNPNVASGVKGSAYTFSFDGAAWSEEAKFTASDGEFTDGFSRTIDTDGENLIVGAYLDDHLGGVDAGSAYIFDVTPTPEEIIADLRDFVVGLGLPADKEMGLTSKLDEALDKLAEGKPGQAEDKLEQFKFKVNKERGKSLTDAEADELIAQADSALAAIQNMP